jgi:hypothetical protein
MFVCHGCFQIMEYSECPLCMRPTDPMCKKDHQCKCPNDVNSGVYYCDTCGKPTCPCGCHDVAQVSRVTGYLSDVAGWNKAKLQELKDRQRTTL